MSMYFHKYIFLCVYILILRMLPLYRTRRGVLYLGDSFDILNKKWFKPLMGKINLIFTSPPFPLNKKKAYGNLQGQDYINWIANFGKLFRELLAPDGSFVIELGNAWVQGSPTMSLLPLEALIEIKKRGAFHLCQQFIWYNPARLPSPIQWVNVERIRVKDAFTRLWWLSKTDHPKANNRHVLQEYSPSMKKLLEKQCYNFGDRPSEYRIGETSFLKDNKGSIPSNVLIIPNTVSTDPYIEYCKNNNIKLHPARMPVKVAEFFIKLLTNKDDLVLDPFAGSNITGYAAEHLGRRWRSIEKNIDYANGSKHRFNNAWFL